jgi:hypothetical protein
MARRRFAEAEVRSWRAFLDANRALLPILTSEVYVAVAALRAHDGAPLRPLVFGFAGAAVSVYASRRDGRTRPAAWGLALATAAAGSDARGWIDVFGAIGAAIAFFAALLAVEQMRGAGGLGASRTPSRVPRVLALLGGTSAWGAALSSGAANAFGMPWGIAREPWAWTSGACAYSGLAVMALAWRNERVRKLDLGVPARARAAVSIAAAGMALAAGLALTEVAATDRIGRLAVALAALMVTRVALAADAVAIARTSRRIVALVFTSGPIILLGMTVAQGRGGALVTAGTAVLAIALGLGSRVFERALRPAQGVWLDAARAAHEAIERADPEDAVRAALAALRVPAGAHGTSPILLTIDPPLAITVDAAGYVHEWRPNVQNPGRGTMPGDMLAVAAREPEASLRTEVLASLEVRRPDLRPILQWMIQRAAALAVVVIRAGEPEGMLVLPEIPRSEPMSLEEVRALKRVADALAGVCHVRAALARSLDRERVARENAERAQDLAAKLQHVLALGTARNALASARLARPATVGIYSAASRLALDAIERRVRSSAPLALVVPSGVDPVPYIARAHLEGPRGQGPLALVDGTASREHDPARWADPAQSPLALADGGTLVLLDGAALPLDVQNVIGRALAERRAPWERPEPLDVALAFTSVDPPATLTYVEAREGGAAPAPRLDAALAARLGDALDAPIALPRLSERPEDLRAIVTDRLAREGLRVVGRPMGLHDAAYARLVEHAFAGEEPELMALVQRVVGRAAARGADVVRASDLDPETPGVGGGSAERADDDEKRRHGLERERGAKAERGAPR